MSSSTSETKPLDSYCPQCKRHYLTDLPPDQGTDAQQEQHLSGICSDICWDKFMGIKAKIKN